MSNEIESELAEPDVMETADRLRVGCRKLLAECGKIIVGQSDVLEQLILAILARGHCLLVGVPGLAKTLMIRTLADGMNLTFSRVQFTPDLMPSDITGTDILQEDKTTGGRSFRFVHGPIFANIVLADEINRTPPKTQAALLEAMQERQVTVAGVRHKLPDPFFVLATQNPIEQEGTYPLPEAQQDRFMFNIRVDYPDEDEEYRIIEATTSATKARVEQIINGPDLIAMQQLVLQVPAAEYVMRYAARLVRATRPTPPAGEAASGPVPDFVKKFVSWGAGPRAGQSLILAAKARALLNSRTYVALEDVKAVAAPVLRHRVITNYNAEADGITPDEIIRRLLAIMPRDGEKS
ncbi:AAA family ATPase [Limnoglobus roseus]|uniref:MoxR family ATPase n=1 Tax=Limnoglobus roseus TaxID=2598579 RepID=A0A5C1APH0_9BACT|nr:MoxR family ATPase [Limnoglobus roseus]QEL19104.1 MoxR family ATPase [Limnoglobus roseus]